jgi:uncharacterized membrane protein YadS
MARAKLYWTEDGAATAIGLLFILAGLAVFGLTQRVLPAATFGWERIGDLATVFATENLLHLSVIFAVSYAVFALSYIVQGKSLNDSLGYIVVFLLATVALIVGGNRAVNHWGLESVIFSLLAGLFISNVFGVPGWLKKSLSSELYIKIGLILLGAGILFQPLLKSGALGLIQSVAVVLGVWYFSFWLCRRFGIDRELSVMLSSAVSICGVSAAIASAGAIKGDPKKLLYVVSLVLIVAVPMIVLMPLAARLMGLNETLAGAWIGGTIDTTGAVVATGTLYGEEALKTATIVKFSQNVLLGIAAFLIAVYWHYTEQRRTDAPGEKPSLSLLWKRFPKFVVGFVLVSLLFSVFFAGEEYAPLAGSLKKFQNLWFTLGFVSIGLETDFRTLINSENRKATFVFLGAQLFNVAFTLLVAFLVFGIKH